MNTAQPRRRNRSAAWLKGLGVAGFLFFLAKGLVWIAVAVMAYCLAA